MGAWLPLPPRYDGGWRLLALSGGAPIALCGEWDGRHYLPLSAWAEYAHALLLANETVFVN